MFLSRIAIEAWYKFAKIPKKNTVSDSSARCIQKRIAIEALYKFAKIPKKNTVSDSSARCIQKSKQV